VTVGEAVFIRVIVRLLVAVPLDVIIAAADPEAVAVTVPEPVFVFVSLLVGVRDAVLVPDLIIESVAVWLAELLGDWVAVPDHELFFEFQSYLRWFSVLCADVLFD
jgi:hypothetical protein